MGASFSVGLWFASLAVIVIVGSSNAVNLTDGLDGPAALKLGADDESPEPAAWATAAETVSNP